MPRTDNFREITKACFNELAFYEKNNPLQGLLLLIKVCICCHIDRIKITGIGLTSSNPKTGAMLRWCIACVKWNGTENV